MNPGPFDPHHAAPSAFLVRFHDHHRKVVAEAEARKKETKSTWQFFFFLIINYFLLFIFLYVYFFPFLYSNRRFAASSPVLLSSLFLLLGIGIASSASSFSLAPRRTAAKSLLFGGFPFLYIDNHSLSSASHHRTLSSKFRS